jgi:hypothetical protein
MLVLSRGSVRQRTVADYSVNLCHFLRTYRAWRYLLDLIQTGACLAIFSPAF